jgi:hypothetical protein
MPKWVRFYVTVKRPDPDKDFPGQIEEGRYRHLVNEDLLEVEDATGRHLGKYPIALGDDPLVIARRVLKEKRSRHLNFHDRIRYPARGIV